MKKGIKLLIELGTLIFLGILCFVIYQNYEFYVIKSGSMLPTIDIGSVVVVDKNVINYEEEDIITFSKGGDIVTHRIVEIQSDELVTKGDNNDTVDPSTVNIKNVRGRVLFSIPFVGNIIALIKNNIVFIAAFLISILVLSSLFFKKGKDE